MLKILAEIVDKIGAYRIYQGKLDVGTYKDFYPILNNFCTSQLRQV